LKDRDAELISAREKTGANSAASSESEAAVEAIRAELEDSRAKLEESLAQLEQATESAESLTRQVAELHSDRDAVKAKLKEKLEKLEKQQNKHGKDSEETEAQLAALTEKLAAAERRETSADEDALAADNAELQAEVQKLEGMVRDRTEQLNKLRWRQQMQEQQEQVGGQSNDKMMVVLNQQLTASREDNERLIEQIRQLETRLESAGSSIDDLSRIRGVGPKLVAQLNELGISQFEQIAALEHEDLEDEMHPLHSFRGRIIKDEWVLQAVELGA
jgi:predicted flap endonuclease-1-like 5' DNA nuclease